MSVFNEENTVEHMVLDTLSGSVSGLVADARGRYTGAAKSWRFVAADQLPRQPSEVLVESMLRDRPSLWTLSGSVRSR